ncbi:MAG: TMEM175 family protein [Chitinophagaceae bacterium]|nr:TMEM175 family protein [Chitinophagaceae bacterium]
MIRQKLFTKPTGAFHERGMEIKRVEALSDAVFAFSVSLLVASLEVPQTFEELKLIISGALPFFATVSILFLFWYQQNVFFRHYGLNDRPTIILNLVYLAIILFYLYPLKFLFSILLTAWTGLDLFPKATEHGLTVLSAHDFPQLIILFSIGYICLWLVVYAMHRRAMHVLLSPALNEYEKVYTLKELRGALLNASIGGFALLFALLKWELIAGLAYLAIPVVLAVNQWVFQKQLRKR